MSQNHNKGWLWSPPCHLHKKEGNKNLSKRLTKISWAEIQKDTGNKIQFSAQILTAICFDWLSMASILRRGFLYVPFLAICEKVVNFIAPAIYTIWRLHHYVSFPNTLAQLPRLLQSWLIIRLLKKISPNHEDILQ